MAGIVVESGASPASTAACPTRAWLVGPWFDTLLIANLAWPLFVLAQLGEGFDGQAGIQFWQLYYITTPHRWITLFLVFLDRERFRQRRGIFLAVAACIIAVCLGVRLATGALTCLLAVDYLWNAWHFAAQHHGIYRIYGRLAAPQRVRGLFLEKWALRVFLLYVIFRVASATWSDTSLQDRLQTWDWIAVLVPAWLLARDLVGFRRQSPGQLLYLLSMSGMYLSLLWCVHTRRLELLLPLATASALFHAIEYLALVTWSVRQRHANRASEMGLLAYLVPRWGIALGVFLVILGAAGWLMDQHLLEGWLTINVMVAFLHYAYDGLIWRRRFPS